MHINENWLMYAQNVLMYVDVQEQLGQKLHAQVLFEDIPVALAAVDCEGNETSIMDCTSNDRQIRNCNAASTSTVLACANSAAKGVPNRICLTALCTI